MAATRWAVVTACGAALLLVLVASPAGADVIDPAGACRAAGTWQDEGVSRASGDFSTGDLIEIPQEDRVSWMGSIGDAAPGEKGPRREISGEVQLDIAGVGTLTIDDWGGSSEKYANNGNRKYDVPSVALNIKMRLHGEHREAPEDTAAFTRVCGGSVYIQAKGGTFANPLSILSGVGMLASGAGLATAAMARKVV